MRRWLAGGLFVVAISGCSERGQTAEGGIGGNVMKYDAGELSIEVPSGWRDTSDYSYANEDESITLRISRLSVIETLSTTDLLNDRKQRLEVLGKILEIQRKEQQIGAVRTEWIEIDVNKISSGDDEGNHLNVRMLVARPSPQRAIMVTMTGPATRRAELTRLWEQMLTEFRFRPSS